MRYLLDTTLIVDQIVRPLIKEDWDYPGTQTTTQYASSANKVAYDYTTYNGASVASPVGPAPFIDSTAAGKAGADPTQAVRWGDPTYDEMLMGLFEYTMDNQSLKPAAAPNAGGH